MKKLIQLSLFDFGTIEDDFIYQELTKLKVNENITFTNEGLTIEVNLNERLIYEYVSADFDGCCSDLYKLYRTLITYLNLNTL